MFKIKPMKEMSANKREYTPIFYVDVPEAQNTTMNAFAFIGVYSRLLADR